MIVFGLTGSIGMGKSTTAGLFAEAGVPVWDADAAVHRLYAAGGAAAKRLAAEFPEAVGEQGVDRAALKRAIAADPQALKRIEAIVHPLVAADRLAFLNHHRGTGTAAVLLDVPLLFETGAADLCDRTVVVTAPAEVQRARVLARPGMTEDTLNMILSRQMPDAEKRKRADFIVKTLTMEGARAQVEAILETLKGQAGA